MNYEVKEWGCFLLLLGFLVMAAATYSGMLDKPKEKASPILTKPVASATLSEDFIVLNDLSSAKSAAVNHNRNIIMIFHASWCGPCRSMNDDVWSHSSMKDVLSKYIVCKLDIDQKTDEARQYGASSIPAYYILNSNGEVLKRGVGNKPANAIKTWLSE